MNPSVRYPKNRECPENCVNARDTESVLKTV
ncbi:MAG: hypothetical protein ACI92E_000914 [Oceanicoccus sp.]|jgi:hypothetical protein